MSNTLTIMIDDTDPGISYSGNWIADKGSIDNLGNFGPPYMSTSHYTKGTGSFSFTFSGTYVGVFGSSVDGKDPSRVCTVDGATIPNNPIGPEVNNNMQCQAVGLGDGQHTLVVTVPTANPNGYWFDFVTYIPSVSVSRANAVLLVEWNDPSIVYGSGWTQNSPSTIATTNGASVSVQFTGRSLTWLGYYSSQFPFAPTTATYTVDGGTPYAFDLNGAVSQSTGLEFNQRLFTTGLLPAGQHTLEVTYNGNSGTTPLSIYNLLVQNGDSAGVSVGGTIGASHPVTATATNGGSGSSSGGSSTTAPFIASPPSVSVMVIGSGASAITVTASNTNSTATFVPGALGSSTVTATDPGASSSDKTSGGGTSSGNNSGSGTSSGKNSGSGASSDADSGNSGSSGAVAGAASKSHTPLGAIIGAVIGVLALLLILVFFLWRRHRKRRGRATKTNTSSSNLVVQPFTAPPTGLSGSLAQMSELLPSLESSSSSGGGVYAPAHTSQFHSDIKRPLPADGGGLAAGSSATPWRQQGGDLHPARQPSQSLSTFSSPTIDATEMPPTYSAT